MTNNHGGITEPSAGSRSAMLVRAIVLVVAAALVAVACSSGDDPESALVSTPTAVPGVEPTVTSDPVPDPTATPQPEPTEQPTPEPTALPVTDLEVVQATWDSFLEGSIGPGDDQDHLTLALEHGTDEARQDVKNRFIGSADRAVPQSYAKIETTNTGWIVTDCFTTFPTAGDASWVTMVAQVVDTEDGPMVESVELPNSFTNCVPAEIAEAVIAGYEAYYDAIPIFFRPADPDHPLVRETTTGLRLEHIVGTLTEAEENGWELRGRPSTHPIIVELGSTGHYLISDCQEQSPERGAFLASTGERLDDLISPIEDGQRDLVSIRMEFVEGVWKVGESGRVVKSDCSSDVPPDALPVI